MNVRPPVVFALPAVRSRLRLRRRRDVDDQPGRPRGAPAIGPLDADEVRAGLPVTVRRDGVAVARVLIYVPVRLDGHGSAAVAEVPGLLAVGRAERPHLESHRV